MAVILGGLCASPESTPPGEINLNQFQNHDDETGKTLQLITSPNEVTRLFMSHNSIEDNGASAIGKTLQANTSLTELNLSSNQIGSVGAQALGTALENNTLLTRLDLGANRIGDVGAQAIGPVLKNNPWLEEVNLCGNEVDETGMEALADGMSSCNRLRILDLSMNRIRHASMTHIARVLHNHLALQIVDLSLSAFFGDDAAKILGEALKTTHSLRTLRLMGNSIGDVGAGALAEALKVHRTLRVMDLSSNDIRDPGAKALAEGITDNTSLIEMDLSLNAIGDSGAQALIGALTEKHILNLSNNCIRVSAVDALLSRPVNIQQTPAAHAIENGAWSIKGARVPASEAKPSISPVNGQSQNWENRTQEDTFTFLKARLQDEMNRRLEEYSAKGQNAIPYEQLMEEVEQKITKELFPIQAEHERVKSVTGVLVEAHNIKQGKVAEQQRLLSNEFLRPFYTTVEKVLGAKLMSAVILTAGMVGRAESKTEKIGKVGTQFAGEITAGLCEGIPFVGGLIGAVAKCSIEQVGNELVTGVKGALQSKKMLNIQGGAGQFKDLTNLAELIARRLTQRFSQHLIEGKLSPCDARNGGSKSVDHIYDYMKTGIIKESDNKSAEEIAEMLVNEVVKIAAQEKGWLRKRGGVFVEKVETTASVSSSAATSTEMRVLRNEIDTIKEQGISHLAHHKCTSIRSLTTEESMNRALTRFKHLADGAFQKQVEPTLIREGKSLTISFPCSENRTLLSHLADYLNQLFDEAIVADLKVDEKELQVVAKTTFVCEQLQAFINQAFA